MSYKLKVVKEFGAIIHKSKSIVVTAHLYPDYDAVCSALLLARTLRFNYPDKQVHVVLEDKQKIGVVADDSQEITIMPILDALRRYNVDCLILTDAYGLGKVTREDKSMLLPFVAQRGIKILVIDHHEGADDDGVTVRIQDPAVPAATQLVHQVCFQALALRRPPNIAQITMLGIVDDSGLFTYTYDYSDTFPIVAELIQEGVAVEQVATVMNQLSIEQISVIAELAHNMKIEADYTYSFISDEFMQNKLPAGCDPSDFKAACSAFGNRYITAIKNISWGFIVYPILLSRNTKEYRVSFRSRANADRDITTITSHLGSSSGHKHAAGANVQAMNVSDALHKVKSAILATD
jgi:nanoRNase/pAp phosphatase (c-di-AMP/oligoRNAs hydrolase)